MLENMKNRRTIRKYTTQDIPDALLNDCIGGCCPCIQYGEYATV